MNSSVYVLLVVLVGAIQVAESGSEMAMIYHCHDYINKVTEPFRGKHTVFVNLLRLLVIS